METITNQADTAVQELKDAHNLLTNATKWLAEAHRATNKLKEDADKLDALNEEFNKTLSADNAEIENLDEATHKANNHSENLSLLVRNKQIIT